MFQFVSEHCCYGKAPAQEMEIKDVVPSSAYHVSCIPPLPPLLSSSSPSGWGTGGGRREDRMEAGFPRWQELGEIGNNFATLCNTLQYRKSTKKRGGNYNRRDSNQGYKVWEMGCSDHSAPPPRPAPYIENRRLIY